MSEKQYTLEEFEWAWKDSSVYDILNQFYYEHIELQKLLQQIDKLTKNWNELEEWLLNHYEVGYKVQNEPIDEVLNKMKEIKEGK